MVTLELAVGLMTTALVLFAASAIIGLLIVQDRGEAIAAQAARFAARGDTEQLALVRARAPKGSTVELDRRDGWVTARVTMTRSWGRIGPVRLQATSSAPLEPGE